MAHSNDRPEPTRRVLLTRAWKLGGAALLLEGIWVSLIMLRPGRSDDAAAELVLTPAEDFIEASATHVPQGRFYITRVKGELFALSQSCPHLGCTVPFCEASGQFECPCHGSKYNLAGEWLEGPSPHGMNRHPLVTDGNRIVVDTGRLEDGPPLGQRDYDTPNRGGRCGLDV